MVVVDAVATTVEVVPEAVVGGPARNVDGAKTVARVVVVFPGRVDDAPVVGPTAVDEPAVDGNVVAPKIVVDVVVVVVVVVLVVDVVVVDVDVVDDGSGAPVIRGSPTNSKCMPSGMLHVPPHAKPLRRNA